MRPVSVLEKNLNGGEVGISFVYQFFIHYAKYIARTHTTLVERDTLLLRKKTMYTV